MFAWILTVTLNVSLKIQITLIMHKIHNNMNLMHIMMSLLFKTWHLETLKQNMFVMSKKKQQKKPQQQLNECLRKWKLCNLKSCKVYLLWPNPFSVCRYEITVISLNLKPPNFLPKPSGLSCIVSAIEQIKQTKN